MNTITNLNTFPIGNSLDGINIITEEINTLSLLVDGTNYMLADLNMDNHVIKNLDAGVDSLDAVNKSQLDLKADTTYVNTQLGLKANTTYVNTQDNLRVLKTGDTMTGKLLLNYATPDIEIRGTQENQNSNLYLSTPYNNGTTKKTAIIASAITSYSRANLHFCLNQVADNTTNVSVSDSKMCIINSTGNVGINTSTPSEKLDVNGNGIIRGSLNMNTANKIINVANGTNNLDAVNKSQLDLKADKTYVDNNFVNLTGTQTITGAKQFNNKIGLDALDLSPTFTEGANIDFDASQLKFKSKGDGIAFKCWSSTSTEPTDDVLVLNNSGYFGTPRTNGGLYLNGSSELWFNPSGSNSLYSKIFQNTSNNKLVFNSFDVTNGGIMSFNSGIGSDTFTEIFNINNSSMNVNKPLNMNSNKIINVANGTNNLDAINFSQLTDLRTYTDSSLNSLRTYTDSSLNSLRTYTDSSLNLLRSYVNTQDNLKVNKAGDTMTNYLQLPEIRLTGQITDFGSGSIDSSNRTNTYAVFDSAGATTDWAFLRQIGGSNDIHLSLDFHDDSNDGKFSLRNINSAENPDGTPFTFFNANLNTTTISTNNTSATAFQQFIIRKGINSQDAIWFHINATTAAYNPLVSSGGKAMLFSNGTKDTGDLAIGPWSDTAKGIKILGSSGYIGINKEPTEVMDINGNLKLSGVIRRSSWSSGELIQTKIYNQNNSGSGILDVNGGNGSNSISLWKDLSFTMLNTTTDSDVYVEISAPFHLSGSAQDVIYIQLRDYTNSTEQEFGFSTAYYGNNSGGGYRSGSLLPYASSYSPSSNTSNQTRSIQIRFNNLSDDTLSICKYKDANNNLNNKDLWSVRISEYKK